mmetsp:Transcript_45505/g.144740  ORF Transcript_45505/g.144740 Transcript_45505/m.144740 type:complete len:108 (-) Transcript_45505:395-718(-)
MLELNPAIARELEQRDRAFPPGITAGVLIPHVLEGSPGDRGGLRAGDVVTHLDGKAVLSPGDIVDGLGAQVRLGGWGLGSRVQAFCAGSRVFVGGLGLNRILATRRG